MSESNKKGSGKNLLTVGNVNYTDSEICLLSNNASFNNSNVQESSNNNNTNNSNNNQKLTVKEMIDNLKKIIDESSTSKLFLSSSRVLLNENTSNAELVNKSENKPELSKLSKAHNIENSIEDNTMLLNSLLNLENKINNNNSCCSNSHINKNIIAKSNNNLKQNTTLENTGEGDEMYPITDSYLTKFLSSNKDKDKNQDLSELVENYDFTVPQELNLKEAFRSLIKENVNLRLYSKDIELELKDLINTNELLENENDQLEKIKRKDKNSTSNNIGANGIGGSLLVGLSDSESVLLEQIVKRNNDLKLNIMQILLNFLIKLNDIKDEIISDKGTECFYNAFEEMINEVVSLNGNMSTNLLQSSIEESVKKNIEFEFFKYKNNYTFNINKYTNYVNEMKHNISSLKKEKEVLLNENRQYKSINSSIQSDLGGSRQSDTLSFTSIASDYQDSKSIYVGSENSIKNSKFSKLTNSAKKIIKNSSNKKLFKDKKARNRGFSVTLPVKSLDDNKDKEKESKRRNSIIDSSMSIPNDEIIPHVFVPHSYIKPTKCEICQELCWRKEVRCKTCGFRCHERCQGQAEKVTSCIVNKVQKANMISEIDSHKKLFGTRISTFGINEIDYIPSIVKCCVNEVEKRGLRVEGIYRKSGNVIKTRNLVKAFDSGETPDISETGEYPDITVITSTLKQYFRDLPESLIPKRLFESIKEIMDNDDELEQIHKMKILIEKELSKYSYETLKFLSLHLNNVDANSDVNLMTSKNLGVVFGPTLIGDPGKTEDNQNSNMISTVCRVRAINLIIRYCRDIFDYNSNSKDEKSFTSEIVLDPMNGMGEKSVNIDNEEGDEVSIRTTNDYAEKNSIKSETVAQL